MLFRKAKREYMNDIVRVLYTITGDEDKIISWQKFYIYLLYHHSLYRITEPLLNDGKSGQSRSIIISVRLE
jgi:hypothetical protein